MNMCWVCICLAMNSMSDLCLLDATDSRRDLPAWDWISRSVAKVFAPVGVLALESTASLLPVGNGMTVSSSSSDICDICDTYYYFDNLDSVTLIADINMIDI